jgi:hypothetical protein
MPKELPATPLKMFPPNDGINLLGHEFYHIRSDAKLLLSHQGFTT